eukprot:4723248-Pyramimonas_sp.AAC.1
MLARVFLEGGGGERHPRIRGPGMPNIARQFVGLRHNQPSAGGVGVGGNAFSKHPCFSEGAGLILTNGHHTHIHRGSEGA